MFWFFKRNKIFFYVLMAVLFAYYGIDNLNDYYRGYFDTAKEKKIKLMFGIIAVVGSLMHLTDAILLYKNRKKSKEEQP